MSGPDSHQSEGPRVLVSIELPESHAYALAELCKRIGFATARDHAISDAEAYSIIYAVSVVRTALEHAGVSVR